MTKYTIGIYFSSDLRQVLLIKKVKPEWQAGKYNFPGGKVEGDESGAECIAREFKEETNLNVPPQEWSWLGNMRGQVGWDVDIFIAVQGPKHGTAQTMTKEVITWFNVRALPINRINIGWLMEAALDAHTGKQLYRIDVRYM